jgi:uncharacterized protein YkwD
VARLKLWITLAACLASLTTSLMVAPALAAPSDTPLAAELVEVIGLVNDERAQYGLGPLTFNDRLTLSAQTYAESMAEGNFFAHTGPDGSTMVGRAEAAGYAAWLFLGENLAGGQTTPERVVAAWMRSPGHRANVLSDQASEIGIGHWYKGGTRFGHYWAMEVGARL